MEINPGVRHVNACNVSRNLDGTFHVVFLNGPAWDYLTPERTYERLVVGLGCDPAAAHQALVELGAPWSFPR